MARNKNPGARSRRAKKVRAEFKGICVYCGTHTIKNKSSEQKPRSFTVDHIVPKCRGGTNQENNLVCACYRCNLKKGTRGWLEFAIEMNYKLGRVK